ncbi:MAG: ABC transporter permease subunit [Fimbriiglobus sp.]
MFGRVARSWPVLVAALWFAGVGAIGLAANKYSWTTGGLTLAVSGWLLVPALTFRNQVRFLFGPVFSYEMTRLGRKKSTFVFRMIYLALVLIPIMIELMPLTLSTFLPAIFPPKSQYIDPAALSRIANTIFVSFNVIQYCVLLVLTPAYVAGSIAVEKERKTLEFLLATDLRSHEIVFGKVAARVASLFFYVLVGVPILGMLQTFGGIDPQMLIASAIGAGMLVIAMSLISVYFSVTRKRPRSAIAMAYLAMILYFVVSGAIGGLFWGLSLGAAGNPTWDVVLSGHTVDIKPMIEVGHYFGDYLAAGNPFYQVAKVIESIDLATFGADVLNAILLRFGLFWSILGSLILLYCFARLRPIALNQAYGGAAAPQGSPRFGITRSQANATSEAEPHWAGRPAIGDDPMFWKEVYVENSGRRGCAAMIGIVLLLILVFAAPVILTLYAFLDKIPVLNWIFDAYPDGRSNASRLEFLRAAVSAWCRITTAILSTFAMLSVAVRGSGAVSGERDKDTWISLISAPLSAWEMLRGKWFGTILGPRRLYYLIFIVWAVALLYGATEPLAVIYSAVIFGIYQATFASIGIFNSIYSKNTLNATVKSILMSVFFGGGFWIFLIICCVVPMAAVVNSPNSLFGRDFAEGAVLFFAGLSAPFMMFWSQLPGFGKRELGPFHGYPLEETGLIFVFIGPMMWTLFCFGIIAFCNGAFRTITNRGPKVLRPVPKARPAVTQDADK